MGAVASEDRKDRNDRNNRDGSRDAASTAGAGAAGAVSTVGQQMLTESRGVAVAIASDDDDVDVDVDVSVGVGADIGAASAWRRNRCDVFVLVSAPLTPLLWRVIAARLISDTALASVVRQSILQGGRESRSKGNKKVVEVAKVVLFAPSPSALMAILANQFGDAYLEYRKTLMAEGRVLPDLVEVDGTAPFPFPSASAVPIRPFYGLFNDAQKVNQLLFRELASMFGLIPDLYLQAFTSVTSRLDDYTGRCAPECPGNNEFVLFMEGAAKVVLQAHSLLDGLRFARDYFWTEGFSYLVKMAIRTDPNALWDIRYHYDKHWVFNSQDAASMTELRLSHAIRADDKEEFVAAAKMLVPGSGITADMLREPPEDVKAALLEQWKTHVENRITAGHAVMDYYSFTPGMADAMYTFLFRQAQIEPQWAQRMLQIPTLQRIDGARLTLRRGIEAADVAASESDGDGLNIRHLKG